MKELSINELRTIEGGSTLCYRMGQAIRAIFMCHTAMGTVEFFGEVVINDKINNKN